MTDEASIPKPTTEADFNALFCAEVGGEQEVRLDYSYGLGESFVIADCETADTVYEGGLDKRSSLDSVQQALFFSAITGKTPAVVIFDTDSIEGQYEFQIRTVAELAGVEYVSYDWQAGLQDEPEVPEIVIPDLPDFSFDFGL